MRASISSSRVTSASGTAFGCAEPARNSSSEVFGSAASAAWASSAATLCNCEAAVLPSACAMPFGSMIMITEPSPRMVLPQNMAMWRNLLDIGFTTISSVWKTASTTMPKVCAPTWVTTMKPVSNCSGAATPSRRLSRATGSSLSRSRSTAVSLMRSMRCSLPPCARTSSTTASCGMAKRSPPASTISAETIARVSGILSVKLTPTPGTERTSMVPPIWSILVRTTSMPTPRPEMLVTAAAVEKPGAKMNFWICASLSLSSSASVASPCASALALMRSVLRPRPSSATWMTMKPPSCQADRRMRPRSGLPAARRSSGVSSP